MAFQGGVKEEAGLTQRAVTLRLGLRDGSGISRRLTELTTRFEKDARLQAAYERILSRLAVNH